MIKKESILAMAAALKMDKAAVEAALTNEAEVEVKLPEDVSVFTSAELSSREEQIKNTAIRTGKELVIKDLKEKSGLDYDGQGSKDPDRFIQEYQKKVLKEANIQESDKVKELNTTIEGLRNNINSLTAEKESMLKATKEAQLDSDILTWTVEKKPENLTNKEWITLLKLNNEIVEHDGQLVVKREGKVVANQTDLKPIAAKDALISYIEERKIGKEPAKPTPGRNGSDSKGPIIGIGNMKQFTEHLQKENINPNGEQAKAMLKEITDANPNFDFSNK